MAREGDREARAGPRLNLGAIDQVGFVVPDLDAACARYEAMFGPWQRAESPLRGVCYRGKPTDVHLRLALATRAASRWSSSPS